ncbi:MAG: coproporphyrinogen III oxidase [Alphaproteobacteria bacterium]|nr:coproporphyrinogen III oxidase [Alphaproteobacteria bacterium]
MTAVPGSLALYVHWPFCRSKCPYCDFNSHVRATIDEARWRAALLAELDHAAALTPGRRLDSIFFGGGTPSLMAPETAAAIIARAEARWGADDDLEITLEANPTSVEAARLRAFRAAGVNRVSLGVQALDDAALRFLGRAHSAAEALAAVDLARAIFARVSFDLIYARPGQTVAAWEDELARALDHAGEHLSVYQLTIEKGTPFHALHRDGAFATPDADAAADFYETTLARLAAAGLPAYEISNHARPGAECRHNLVYWQGGDYAGIGPGAHGRLTLADGVHATETAPLPEAWLAAVEASGHAIRADVLVDAPARRDEIVMMGLRLARGIERARFARLAGRPLEGAFDRARLGGLVDGGFLVLDDDGLRATAAGRQRLDAVLARLLG